MYPVGDEVNCCDVQSKLLRNLYRVSSEEVFLTASRFNTPQLLVVV